MKNWDDIHEMFNLALTKLRASYKATNEAKAYSLKANECAAEAELLAAHLRKQERRLYLKSLLFDKGEFEIKEGRDD